MNLLVCAKQVPDNLEIKWDAAKNQLDFSGAALAISEYDKNALEAAVQLKEQLGGSVTVVSVGNDQALKSLKACIAVGADRAVLIQNDQFRSPDAFATGAILAAAIKKLGSFDVIFCGDQAMDTNAGQVGIQLAEQVNIPQIRHVTKIVVNDEKLTVDHKTEDGYQVIETNYPILLTASDTLNEPRLATIKSKMAANRAKIEQIKVSELNLSFEAPPLHHLKISAPEPKKTGISICEKSGRDSAQKLFDYLAADKLV